MCSYSRVYSVQNCSAMSPYLVYLFTIYSHLNSLSVSWLGNAVNCMQVCMKRWRCTGLYWICQVKWNACMMSVEIPKEYCWVLLSIVVWNGTSLLRQTYFRPTYVPMFLKSNFLCCIKVHISRVRLAPYCFVLLQQLVLTATISLFLLEYAVRATQQIMKPRASGLHMQDYLNTWISVPFKIISIKSNKLWKSFVYEFITVPF